MRTIWSILALLSVLLTTSPAQGADQPLRKFKFKDQRAASYEIEESTVREARDKKSTTRLKARRSNSSKVVEITDEVAIHLKNPAAAEAFLAAHKIKGARSGVAGVLIVQAANPLAALELCERLVDNDSVAACYPLTIRPLEKHGSYAAPPTDPYFKHQWHLENRRSDGSQQGPDLNVRAAWPVARGENITVGVVDDGIDLSHPDLAPRAMNALHYNFAQENTDANPFSPFDNHGTAVSGLIAAQSDAVGQTAPAPLANLVSLKIFLGAGLPLTEQRLSDVYQYHGNEIGIQNHSWGYGGIEQLGPSPIEELAISNAATLGRNGRGVIFVRSGGNYRVLDEFGFPGLGNVNDDGYPSNPFTIAVGAVGVNGRAADYSNPGASLLVAAPSGQNGGATLFTTDRVGGAGYNPITNYFGNTPDLGNYAFDGSGFTGTSGAAPQISGVAALILSANTNLGYRDVQQILVHSARHFTGPSAPDPSVRSNAAGFAFSHNVGFGIPDAGVAVQLAKAWSNRPVLTSVTLNNSNTAAISDAGLRVHTFGTTALPPLIAMPSLGLHPDDGTARLPLIAVGSVQTPLATNLTGKAALIQRGVNNFSEKIQFAADAGAAFVVMYNNRDGNARIVMGSTDYSPIPAVFISQIDGEALSNYVAQTGAEVELRIEKALFPFAVTNQFSCEHVSVTVAPTHERRGDLRITLVSPQGTRSVMQRMNYDTNAAIDWTYHSTQHFYEASAGTWTVEVSDQNETTNGIVNGVALTLRGVAIADSDADGLDDNWEMARLGTLAYGLKDDPDKDGFQNAREQILGSNPLALEPAFVVDLSRWNTNFARLSWPGFAAAGFEVSSGDNPANLTVLTNVPGKFPVTEWFAPSMDTNRFFRVKALPAP